jgi:invasion protein IalB
MTHSDNAHRKNPGLASRGRASMLGSLMLATLLTAGAATSAPLPGGASSLVETYEDWGVACQMQSEAPACVLRQFQTNNQTKQVVLTVELSSLPAGTIRGVLLLPLGLSLQQGARLTLDDAALGDPLPFSTCVVQGCAVALDFDADTVAKLKSGKTLGVTVTSGAPGAPATFAVSFKGFSAALGRVADLMK